MGKSSDASEVYIEDVFVIKEVLLRISEHKLLD